MNPANLLLPLFCLGLGAGCSSVNYGDPDATETVTIDWGSKDLQTFAKYMIDSLAASPNLAYLDAPGKERDMRVIAVFGGIANETSEHINTDQISRLVQSELFELGKFRFVVGDEAAGQEEVQKQLRFQNSGLTDEASARQFGRQLNADVVIFGALSDIRKERGRSIESLGSKRKDLYYQFYMGAVNVETGELLWTKTEDIRKTQTVGLFGRG
ncbi:MAG: penicillin-binding protein activator LpoB [Planctomycetota bacterium]